MVPRLDQSLHIFNAHGGEGRGYLPRSSSLIDGDLATWGTKKRREHTSALAKPILLSTKASYHTKVHERILSDRQMNLISGDI